MSNNLDPLSNPLNIQTIKEIDKLDLPIMQKHYVRILAHCLQILKIINVDNSSEFFDKNSLREWCDNQSRRFEDKNFSDLFYAQLNATAKKLSILSQRLDKNIKDLEIDDLVLLVEQSQKPPKLIPKKKYIFVESLTNLGNKI